MTALNINGGSNTRQDIEFQRGLDTSWVFQNKVGGADAPLPSDTCASLILEHVVMKIGTNVGDWSLPFVELLYTNPGGVSGSPVGMRMYTAYSPLIFRGFARPGPVRLMANDVVKSRSSGTTWASSTVLLGGTRLALPLADSITGDSSNVYYDNSIPINFGSSFYMGYVRNYLHTNAGDDLPSLYTFGIDTAAGTVTLDLTGLGTLNNSAWTTANHPLGAETAVRWDAYGFPCLDNVECKYELVLTSNGKKTVGAYGTFKTLKRWTTAAQANVANALNCPS